MISKIDVSDKFYNKVRSGGVFNRGFNEMIKILPEDMNETILKIKKWKVVKSEHLMYSKNIVLPKKIVLHNDKFVGYTMEKLSSKKYEGFDNFLNKKYDEYDLYDWADLFSNFESIIRCANQDDIVIPDLLTLSNVLYNEKEKDIRLIDYDGMQVHGLNSTEMSTNLYRENDSIAFTPKYFNEDGVSFSKNLDILSVYVLYFMAVMHVDIERMQYDKTMTLDKLFKQMRLDDIDVKHKIWKLYSKKQDNVYFGNDFYNLAEKYDLKKIKNHPNNQKNFVRK